MSTEVEQRMQALEAAYENADRALAAVVQRVDSTEHETERLWTAVQEDRGQTAAILHRVDRLEGAFDSQWNVLRRLELEALESRKDMHRGFREVRNQISSLGARIGHPEPGTQPG